MDKPISLTIEETKQSFIDVINNANLPACILELIVKNIYDDVKEFCMQQYQNDKKEYDQSLQNKDCSKSQNLESAGK